MNRIFLFLGVILPSVLSAQKNGMSLQQCLDFAVKNATSIQISKLDEQIATAKVKETAGLGLPQVTGSVSVINNTKLRRFFAQYSEDSFFFSGQSVPGLTEGDVVSAQNFFSAEEQWRCRIKYQSAYFQWILCGRLTSIPCIQRIICKEHAAKEK